MTEEMNVEVKETKCNCLCQSEEFRKFVVVALGSFVGVFCALSLFAALHKPPKMCPPCYFRGPMMQHQMYRGHNFDKVRPHDFDRAKFEKHRVQKEIPVRVEVEKP